MGDIQLVYISTSNIQGSEREQLHGLRSILSTSRKNNQRDGITGFLAFDRSFFFQVLEGDRDKVMAAFARIGADPRHKEVRRLEIRSIRGRSFPEWSMGGSMRSPENQAIYLRHGIGSHLDPLKVTSATILRLAMDLQDFERTQRLALKSA